MQKWMWFICGMLIGLTALSITRASVPTKSQLTDDTVISQSISEIHIKKEKIDFDSDISRLSKLEGNFQERLQGPLYRISQEKYRPSQNVKKINGSRIWEKKVTQVHPSAHARHDFMNRKNITLE